MKDVHIHIEQGNYNLDWIHEFVKFASIQGLDEIYLLEHFHRFREFQPMYSEVCNYSDFQKAWFERKFNLLIQDYSNLIKEVKQHVFPIKIKFGLEVCYFEGYENLVKDIVQSYPFDFLTGSVHWVDGFGFDHKKDLWDNIDVDITYKRYYKIMESLIQSKLFTGVAHPDSIKCFGHTPSFDLAPTYEKIAKLLNENNMYTEQSGGLSLNYHTTEMGLNPLMLKIFKENGVTIETASDAHKPSHVGINIKQLQAMI